MMASVQPNYAGFWLRLCANMVDSLIWVVIAFPILISVYGWNYFDPDVTGWLAGPLDLVVSYIFPSIVTVAFWTIKQATPGKMSLSLKILDARSGERASLGQYIVRYLMSFVSLICCGLGFFWVAFDQKKQGWHDKVAKTIVVQIEKRSQGLEFNRE